MNSSLDRRRLALAAAVLCLAAAARAQDYWVDAISGDDAIGTGSEAQPWQTITFALSHGPATIHVRPGLYDDVLGETFPLALVPPGNLLGSGSDVTVVRTATDRTLLSMSGTGDIGAKSTVDGFAFTRSTPPGATTTGIEIEEGSVLRRLRRCIVDGHSIGVHAQARSLASIEDCEVRNSTTGMRLSGMDTVERCLVEHCDTGIDAFAPFDPSSSARPLIANSTIASNRFGVAVSGRGETRCYPTPPYCYSYGGQMYAVLDADHITGNEYGVDMCAREISSIQAVITSCLLRENGDAIRTSDCIATPGPIRALIANDTIVANSRTGISLAQPNSQFYVRSDIVFGNGDDLRNLAAANVAYCDVGQGDFAGTNANISANPEFVDPPSGNFRLGPGSPCVEAGARFPTFRSVFGLDLDGRVRFFDYDRDGEGRIDIGALERVVGGIGPRYGNVFARGGPVRDVFRVNHSIGDPDRVLEVAAGTPLLLEMAAPWPVPSHFALFAFVGEASANDEVHLPANLGTAAFRFPVAGADRRVLTVFDNFGPAIQSRLGAGLLPSSPAPFSITLGGGFTRAGRSVTLQGLIEDRFSPQGAYAITNGVVVRVR
jgi:uncharacterized protein DUF1565